MFPAAAGDRSQIPGPSDYQQKINFQTFVPGFGSLTVPVMPVMTVMIVGMISVVMPVMIVAVVTIVIAVPSWGWKRATGYDCADNT